MEYHTLPTTGDRVSRLVLGTLAFGSKVGRDDAASMVSQCLDAGITMFDTANSYNTGESERILGEIVAPCRSEVLIASKVWNVVGPGADDRGLSRAAIHKALDASLRRLGTDYLDVYYLHKPDWETPIEETLEAMNDAVAAGKVRQVGISNYAAWQVAEIRGLLKRNGRPGIHVSQPVYNLLSRRIEDEYVSCSDRYDLHNIVYNPLAGGLLTGKHTDMNNPTAGSRFTSEMGKIYRERYWNDAQFAAVNDLKQIATDAGLSLIQLAYRWLLGRPVVGSILLGASSPAQLKQNLAAASGPPVTVDVESACDKVWTRLHGAAPRYNRLKDD